MKNFVIALVSVFMIGGSAFSYAGGYRHHGFKHHYGHHGHYRHRHHSDRGAYLAGGIILGSLISHAYHHSRYHRPHYYERRPAYRTRIIERPVYYTPGRHLYRDLQGNCYEITRSDHGDELREELPAQECNW